MISDIDRRRERKRRLLVGMSLGTMVTGCLALLVYSFIR
jgi:hypothetical protein